MPHMTPIEIKAKRISYLVPLPFILLLMFLFYKYAIVNSGEGNDKVFFIVGIFVVGVGAFLAGYFTLQFFRNPAILRANEQGFEYNPAGVSLGFIPWKDVSGFEEVMVRVVRGDVPTHEQALAIILKDPEQYRKRFTKPVSLLMAASEKINKGTILIEHASMQGRYEEFKALLEQQTRKFRDPWMNAGQEE